MTHQDSTPSTSRELTLARSRLLALRDRDLRFQEFGEHDNLSQIQELKQKVIAHLEGLLDLLGLPGSMTCQPGYQQGTALLDSYIEDLEGRVAQVDNDLVPAHMSNPEGFLQLRLKMTERLRAQLDVVHKGLQLPYLELRQFALLSAKPQLIDDLREAQSCLEKVKEDAALVSKYAEKAGVSAALANSRSIFRDLSFKHWLHEGAWLLVSVISAACFLYNVYKHFPQQFGDIVPNNIPGLSPQYAIVLILIRKILLMSVPLVFLRLGLQKYSAERQVRTAYDHKRTIMEQFEVIESMLTSDEASKATLRMEVARSVLSPPAAGFTTPAEVNFNPILELTEKAVQASKP